MTNSSHVATYYMLYTIYDQLLILDFFQMTNDEILLSLGLWYPKGYFLTMAAPPIVSDFLLQHTSKTLADTAHYMWICLRAKG